MSNLLNITVELISRHMGSSRLRESILTSLRTEMSVLPSERMENQSSPDWVKDANTRRLSRNLSSDSKADSPESLLTVY